MRKQPEQTPVMRQYSRIKENYPDKILLFRMGDFYEMFYEDAKIASRLLGIALTSRDGTIPMAGIPHHSATTYIRRLLNEGLSVVICEQLEEPSQGKKLLSRDVTRVITPGTVVEEELLTGVLSNNIAAVAILSPGIAGVAWADASTGEFYASESSLEMLSCLLERISPSELLISESAKKSLLQAEKPLGGAVRELPDYEFDASMGRTILCEQFGVATLDGFGLETSPAATAAAGVLLKYLRSNHKEPLSHIRSIRTIQSSDNLVIDRTTARSLELLENINGSEEGSLFKILDSTVTPMGKRLLRQAILAPLCDVKKIEERLDSVEELLTQKKTRKEFREHLKSVGDLSRLLTRIVLKRCNARDLNSLANSLETAARIKNSAQSLKTPLIQRTVADITNISDVSLLIRRTLVDEPPLTIKEGNIIRKGYNEHLDRIRKICADAEKWLKEFEEKERKRTGISSLKVGYNRLFGYYIELPQSKKESVPSDYKPLQTLKNVQRYENEELKQFERESLGASERAAQMEYELFCALRDEVAKQGEAIQLIANALATLDLLSSFAETADRNRYNRPVVDESLTLSVKDGRHPVIEKTVDFIPNDTEMDADNDSQILLITGPNMAGKSTYIRQTALIVIMAQMGSFVPAKTARIGICDRIFSRVGASDELYRGRSTFLVEMAETANILNNATNRSLIILDEIGRGTSTFDGLAIAWAVTECLHESVRARTLFATHYHELTLIAKTLPRIKNLCVGITEYKGRIVFLHKIKEGAADRSYGIYVAQLAGIPEKVIERARNILEQLEKKEQYSDGSPRIALSKPRRQMTLFDFVERRLTEELLKIEPEHITPIEALQLINSLKKLAEKSHPE
ncbi:MAG: DNA mismatch repair protein MutS [Planctomycetota bacterium]|nr:DNA mismatch repair protein MutS [Planctomycetota bacterium]